MVRAELIAQGVEFIRLVPELLEERGWRLGVYLAGDGYEVTGRSFCPIRFLGTPRVGLLRYYHR